MAKHYLNLSKILQKLLYDNHLNTSELAEKVNLPQPTVHRLVTGQSTRPYRSSLEPIAHFFNIDVGQLLGEKPLPMNFADTVTQLPFIAWGKLETREKDIFHPPVPFIGTMSVESFATNMPDTSMEPLIPQDSLLICDPALQPCDRGYVLVKLTENKSYMLRELLIDGEHRFLKPLNTDFKMRLLHNNDMIIACLAEIRHTCRPLGGERLLEKNNADVVNTKA